MQKTNYNNYYLWEVMCWILKHRVKSTENRLSNNNEIQINCHALYFILSGLSDKKKSAAALLISMFCVWERL